MLQTGSAAVSSFILLAVLLILPTYLSAQKMSEKLTFNVKHISEDLRVSDVSDPQWKTAYHLEVTRYWDGSDAQLGRRATVRLLWSDKALYVRFDADDTSPWFTMMARDMNLWEEEVVEIFIDPGGRGLDYYELEISPGNVVCDLRVRTPYPTLRSDAGFDLDGLESEVTLYGETADRAPGWVATAALPFAGLRALPVPGAVRVPPAAGDAWRFNVFRIKRPNGPMRPRDGAILAAWSPTGGPSFHVPSAFQPLRFR